MWTIDAHHGCYELSLQTVSRLLIILRAETMTGIEQEQ